jgi:hypothetical protein
MLVGVCIRLLCIKKAFAVSAKASKFLSLATTLAKGVENYEYLSSKKPSSNKSRCPKIFRDAKWCKKEKRCATAAKESEKAKGWQFGQAKTKRDRLRCKLDTPGWFRGESQEGRALWPAKAAAKSAGSRTCDPWANLTLDM